MGDDILFDRSPDDRMDALTRLVQNGVGRPLRCAPEHWESGRTYLVLNAVACELQVGYSRPWPPSQLYESKPNQAFL
jgi:hypothetical protein